MDTTNAHHDTSEDAEAPDTHVQTADNTQARTVPVPADSSPAEDSPAATVVTEPATASSYPSADRQQFCDLVRVTERVRAGTVEV